MPPGSSPDRTVAPATASGNHLGALDGLRGIAALIVVLGHSCYLLYDCVQVPPLWQPLLRAAARSAHPSVILFFVLSGFVLYLAFAKRGATPYIEFIVRRILRIYPAMIVVFAGVVALVLAVAPIAQPGLGQWTNALLVFPIDAITVLRNLLLVGTRAADSAIDPVTWSLAIEMRFSIVFPLLALLCRRNRWAIVALSFAAYIAGRLLFVAIDLPPPYLFGRTALGTVAVTLFYFPCFGFGIAAADLYLARRARGVTLPPVAATAVALGLLIAAKLINDDLAWAVAFTVLLLVACQPGAIGNLARSRTALFFGRVSYSLYLVHLPVLIALVYALHTHLPVAAIAAAAPLVSIGLALAMYYGVELPGIAAGRRFARALARDPGTGPARPAAEATAVERR